MHMMPKLIHGIANKGIRGLKRFTVGNGMKRKRNFTSSPKCLIGLRWFYSLVYSFMPAVVIAAPHTCKNQQRFS